MKTFTFESLVKTADLRLYGTFRRRTLFFKALSAVLAFQMFFIGAVPFSAVAGGNLPEMSGGYKPGMTVDGNTLTIDSSAGSRFTWDRGFNIGADYTVQFQGIGTAVNKDTSGSRSDIFGALKSDGAVYILNPNGILFGSSARVDVHGLVAAAASSVSGGPGSMKFSKLGSGDVVNKGRINAGQFAYLVGKSVENHGSISAGTVALAAFGGTGADSLTIASAPNGAKITFHIPGQEDETEDGETDDTDDGGEANAATDGDDEANADSSDVIAGANEQADGGSDAGNDRGGSVVSAGTITGAADEQAGDGAKGGSTLRGNPDPVPGPDGNGKVNIAIAGGDIVIDTDIGKDDATVKTVDISGNSVKIGRDDGGVTVAANDGSVIISAADFINVLKDATITAARGDTADAANVTMTAGGDITMGGTIKADNDVRITGGGIGEDAVTVNGAINTSDGDITITGTGGIDVNAALDAAHLIPLPGDAGLIHELGDITLDAGGGAIGIAGNVTAATLTLKSATGITAGTTQAATIASDGKTLTVQGENTAIIADNITGPVVQQGGTIQAQPRTGTQNGTLVFGSTVTQSGGRIGGLALADGSTPVATDDISIAGALTQSGGQINAKTLTLGSGASQLEAGGTVEADNLVLAGGASDVDLNGKFGTIGTAAGITAGNVSVYDGEGGLVLAELKAASLSLETQGAMTQTGAATISGKTRLKALETREGNITLANADNDFAGTVEAYGRSVTLTDKNGITLGDANAILLGDEGGVRANGGDVVVETVAGDIVVNAGVKVQAETGSVGLHAKDNVTIGGQVRAGNDVTAQAEAGAFVSTAAITALGGGIRLLAKNGATVGGQIDAGYIRIDAGDAALAVNKTVSGQNVTLHAGDDITEAAAVSATADKYVVSENGGITETVAGTVGGNAALVAKQGSISGDQTIAAGGIVYLEVKDGGTLGATAAGTQGNRLVAGGDQILSSGGKVKVESDKITFTGAPVVAADVAGKKVVVANADNNTSVEIGTLTGGTDQKIEITEVLADPAGGGGHGMANVTLAAAGTGLADAEGIKSASLEIDTGTGAITQTKKIETGATALKGGAITLDNSDNKMGAITIADGEGAVTIRETDDIVIASATHTGRLTLDAGVNSISQTGAIVLNTRLDNVGAADLTGGAITLENSGNKLGGVIVRDGQGNVSLNGGNGLAVTSIARTDGNVTLAGGEILAWPVAGESVPASISIGDGTLTLKADTRWDGTIRAGAIDAAGKTLTIRKSNDANTADVNIGETITAATLDVDAGTVDAKNIVATTKVDQDGGQITVAETITGNVEQKGASESVTLSAKKIDGTLTQESGNAGVATVGEVTGAVEQNGGKILKKSGESKLAFGSTVTQHGGSIATAADDVDIVGKLTQDNAAATLNASTLTLKGGAEQTDAKGKVVATTLVLDNAAAAVSLTFEANDFGTARGVAAAAALVDANAIQLGEVATTGTLDVEAKGGAITQTAADKVVAGGAATLKATTDITLANAANDFQGAVTAEGASVTLEDANDLTITKAVATDGNVDIGTGGGLTVQDDGVSAAAGIVKLKAGTSVQVDSGDIAGATVSLDAGTSIQTAAGTAIEATGANNYAGEVWLTAAGEQGITLGGTTKAADDITVRADGGSIENTGAITATAGDIRLLANQNVTVGDSDGGTVTSDAGDVLIDAGQFDAGNGQIVVNQAVSGRNVTLRAADDITENAAVSTTGAAADGHGDKLVFSGGEVNVNAAGAITGKGAYTAEALTVKAGETLSADGEFLYVNAGSVSGKLGGNLLVVSGSDDAVRTTGGTVEFGTGVTTVSGATKVAAKTADDFVVANGATALEVGAFEAVGDDVTIKAVQPVSNSDFPSPKDIPLGASGFGALEGIEAKSVDIDAGNVTVNADVTADNAVAIDGPSVTVNAGKTVKSTGGNVTVTANGEGGAATVAGTVKAENGDALVKAENGSAEVSETGLVTAKNAAVTAKTVVVDGTVTGEETATVSATDGDIQVAGLVEATGDAGVAKLSAAGSITDDGETVGHADDVAANPFATGTYAAHVKGATVELTATDGGIGAATTPLDIEAGTVTAVSDDGSVYLFEGNAVMVDKISAKKNAKIETAAGAITIADTGDGITAAEGDILVAANNGAIVQGAAITATKGDVSVIATGAIAQNADITATEGTVDIESTDANIVVASAATTTAGGNIRYKAAGTLENGGTVKTTAADGLVSLEGSALAGAGTVEADKLALKAESIGAEANPFKTKVSEIAAKATVGGIFLENDGDVTVSTLPAQNGAAVKRISLDSSSTEIGGNGTGESIGGLVADKGSVKLETKDAGDITVDADVVAGDGDATLTANGDGKNVVVNSLVEAANGSATIKADKGAAEVSGAVFAKTDATVTGKTLAKVGSYVTATGEGATVTVEATGDDGKAIVAGTVQVEKGSATVKADKGTAEVSGIVTAKTDATVTAKTSAEVKTTGKVYVTGEGAIATVEATGDDATATVAGTVQAEKGSATVKAVKGAAEVSGRVWTRDAATVSAKTAEVTQYGQVIATGDDGIATVEATGENGAATVAGAVKATGANGQATVSANGANGKAGVSGTVEAGWIAKVEATGDAGEATIAGIVEATGDFGEATVTATKTAKVENGGKVKANGALGVATVEATGDAGEATIAGTVEANGFWGEATVTATKAVKVEKVENGGMVQANGSYGEAKVEATGDVGEATVAGTVEATGEGGEATVSANGANGKAEVSGAVTASSIAKVEATGDAGEATIAGTEGTVEATGEYGEATVKATKTATVENGATVKANGDSGAAVVAATGDAGVATVAGTVEAIGEGGGAMVSANGANGKAEVSGTVQADWLAMVEASGDGGEATIAGTEGTVEATGDSGAAAVTATKTATVENGATVKANGDNGVAIVEATGDAGEATIAGTVEATGEGGSATVSANGADGKAEVTGTVTAGANATVEAQQGTVALKDNALVQVTGGDAADDPAIVLNGAKGVTSESNTKVDATGANLDVDAAEGAITLAGKVLAKDADFTAQDAVEAANAENDFTGTVTADGASVTLKDGKGGITLGNVTAKTGDVTVDALNGGGVNVNAGATVKSTKADVILNADGGTSTISGTVDAKQNAEITSANGSITLADGSKVTADTMVKLDGKTGVTGAGTVDATGATLDVDAAGGKIDLTGKVLAKDATFDANNNISVANAENDFTGTVKADGANVKINDKNTLKVAKVKSSGYAVVTAGDKITVQGEGVSAGGNVLVSTKKGGVDVNKGVTGKNVTVTADKGNITATAAKLTAKGGDLLVETKGGKIDVKDASAEKHTMALIASGNVTATAPKADTIYTKSGNTATINNSGAKKNYIDSKGDASFTAKGDATLGVKTAGNVNVQVGGKLTAGGDASSMKNLPVNEVLESGKLKNPPRNLAAGSGGNALEGIVSTAKDVNVTAKSIDGRKISADKGTATVNATGGDYAVKTTNAGSKLDLDVEGSVKDADKITGGTIEADVKGGLSAGEVSASRDATLTVGDNATIDTLSAGTLTADIGGGLDSTKVDVTGDATLNVGDDVTVKDTLSAGTLTADIGGSLESTTVEVKDDATVTVGDNVTVTDFSAGNLTADIGGDLTSEKTFTVNGEALLERVGGSATFNELTAGKLTADIEDDIVAETATVNGDTEITAGGKAEFGSFTGSKVSVAASHGITTTGAGIKSSNLTLKGGDIDVTLDSQTINSISGGNVTIVELAHDHEVTLGTVAASGDLNLTAHQIGIGTKGETGYNRGSLSAGGNMLLDVAGHIGSPSDRILISVGGLLTLKSGDLHGWTRKDERELGNFTDIYFLYLLLRGDDRSTDTMKAYMSRTDNWWNGYNPDQDHDGVLPGLVIYNNTLLAGSPELLLRMFRALAFTVETPELKSRQGVFGAPLFIHTDMDVSEAASIGTVDNITIANAHMETLDDSAVRNKYFFTDKNALNYLESNQDNPSRRDKLYTKEFKSEK